MCQAALIADGCGQLCWFDQWGVAPVTVSALKRLFYVASSLSCEFMFHVMGVVLLLSPPPLVSYCFRKGAFFSVAIGKYGFFTTMGH